MRRSSAGTAAKVGDMVHLAKGMICRIAGVSASKGSKVSQLAQVLGRALAQAMQDALPDPVH